MNISIIHLHTADDFYNETYNGFGYVEGPATVIEITFPDGGVNVAVLDYRPAIETRLDVINYLNENMLPQS